MQPRDRQHQLRLRPAAGQSRAPTDAVRWRRWRLRNLVCRTDRLRSAPPNAEDGAGLVAASQWRRRLARADWRCPRRDPRFRAAVRVYHWGWIAATALAWLRPHNRAAIDTDPAYPGDHRRNYPFARP